jgi:hypothetical protein
MVYFTTFFSNYDYIASNERVMNWDLEGNVRDLILTYYPGIQLRLRKTMKIQSG